MKAEEWLKLAGIASSPLETGLFDQVAYGRMFDAGRLAITWLCHLTTPAGAGAVCLGFLCRRFCLFVGVLFWETC